MGRVRRKRVHKNIKDTKRKFRTRRRTKDIDQIHDDMKAENATKLLEQPPDASLPGLGQHYCLECARYFVDMTSLQGHIKSKVHKRRLKELAEPAYTQREAEAAAGMGSYTMDTQAVRATKVARAEVMDESD
ncbi:zinc finger protein 593-like [Corticium candelabrum]|uniref:zinc finger protein 593-like n=1 Tax=Corticium candelabrum TaxID=121492 RepID=UPI002E25FBDA|nr:zinc finger protein 593-like [Corticium candelabrum]